MQTPPTELQHTLGHVNCPACEYLKRTIMRTGELGACLFPAAAELWLEAKAQTVGARTAWDYKHYIRALSRFFSELRLQEIHIGHIVEYRKGRQVTAGAARINHEVQTLGQILDMAGLWKPIERVYKPMRLPKTGPGQALLEVEAEHLFNVASRKSRWRLAYLCELISANTTCGPGEIKNLRLRDIDLQDGTIYVLGGAKNDNRIRTIPLNTDALWAMEQLLEMAEAKGSVLPEHYLLPHRAHQKGMQPDPTRPMGSWKKGWYAIRAEAAKKYPKLLTVRMYDIRHHAITTLLENPNISEQTAKDIAGHGVSSKLLERYSHIRLAKKRAALEAVEGLRKPAGPMLVRRIN